MSEIVSRRLALVILGFEVSSIKYFHDAISKKKILTDAGFKNGQSFTLQSPNGASNAPQFPIIYSIKNDEHLSIQYYLLDGKLIISHDNYKENDKNSDTAILKILETLLTIAPSASITGFGINYSTDVAQDEKLCLFNSDIESKFGQSFWDTNIGFRTELIFQNNGYNSTYRIFKDEKRSIENNKRFYIFDVNFDFTLTEDNRALEIVEIFKKNSDYFNIYSGRMENILKLGAAAPSKKSSKTET